MSGVAWFVALVAYPLFARVGTEAWPPYHALHSRRVTWVVLPAMAVELMTSLWLPFDPPARVGTAPLAAGALLAVGTWVLTALAAREHGRLAAGPTADPYGRLTRVHGFRTGLWSAHAALLIALAGVASG